MTSFDIKEKIRPYIPSALLKQKTLLFQLLKWHMQGKPMPPPPFIKRKVIKKYSKLFSLKIFVETGTYFGDTTMSMKDLFETIYSIELDTTLFKRACDKFIQYPYIHILHGDSAEILPTILSNISQPTMFWLDGHYSGGVTAKGSLHTPILKELESILHHPIKNHVILIDDARCFVGKDDYPTLSTLQSIVSRERPELLFQMDNDIIRILPQK